LQGIHFAMEFLSQQNKRVSGIEPLVDHRGVSYANGELLATGKNVVVIGGGDTGSDCVGTSGRQGAKSVTQIELMPIPPKERDSSTPWPNWPMMLRTSTSHEEGCDRHWSINTKEFIGDENGHLKAIKIVDLDWQKDAETGRLQMKEVAGSERTIPCELALFAAGQTDTSLRPIIRFLQPETAVAASHWSFGRSVKDVKRHVPWMSI
jgi:glutamate synthase (NADPH/NADH) small chain